MSNPYDPPSGDSNPYGQNDPYGQGGTGGQGGQGGGWGQYGQPGQPGQPNPYGQQSPYGAPNPYGQNPNGQPSYGAPQQPGGSKGGTDAVSITGFVLSLTCCLSLVGAILGFIGLRRTKDGQRSGRWAAISAIIVGIIGTLALAGIIIAGVFFANNVVSPTNAEVGQCADVISEEDDTISFFNADCDSGHDIEVVYVGTYSEIEATNGLTEEDVCRELISPDDAAKIDAEGGLEFRIVTEDTVPNGDEGFFCYVEATVGQLDGSILG